MKKQAILLLTISILMLVYFTPPIKEVHATSSTHPTGIRVVGIRTLDTNSIWVMPGYTAQDVLGWINDLKPNTLARYTTGNQSATTLVPVASGQPQMTVLQFLQATLNDMGSNATIYPRLSLKDYYGSSTLCPTCSGTPTRFYNYARNMFNVYNQISPPQTLLSIDNENLLNMTDSSSINTNLRNIGYTGISWGACGVTTLTNGYADFALICSTHGNTVSSYTVNIAKLNTLRANEPSIQEYEEHIDTAIPMTQFENLSSDDQARVLTNLSINQTVLNYHFQYLFYEHSATFSWDSTKVFTSSTGPWHGASIYTVMKNLINTYTNINMTKFYVDWTDFDNDGNVTLPDISNIAQYYQVWCDSNHASGANEVWNASNPACYYDLNKEGQVTTLDISTASIYYQDKTFFGLGQGSLKLDPVWRTKCSQLAVSSWCNWYYANN